MSEADYIAEQIRALRSETEDLRRRLASVVMVGQVVENQGEKMRLEFEAKDSSTGKPFRSPMIRRANSAGKDGAGHKERNRPAIGETMILVSPNGEIGAHSRAMPYGPTDESGEPAGDESYPRILAEGNASIAIKAGEIRIKVGGAVLTLTEASIKALVGGAEHEVTGAGNDFRGGTMRHDGVVIDKTHGHVTAPPGPPGPPVS